MFGGIRIYEAKCPNCKKPMQWSEINQQWYCPKCEIFHQPGPNAPRHSIDHVSEEIKDIFKPKPQAQIHTCRTCGTPVNWVPEYSRWYCYICRQYI